MKATNIKAIALGALLATGNFAFTGNQASSKTLSSDALSAVVAQWALPGELREVSGIAWLDDNTLACVQDEEGAIYLYDLQQKAVKGKIPFAGPGDYEGIALNGTTAYILRSDGAIFEVKNFNGSNPTTTEHPSNLAGTQNTEGLAYDAKQNRLLIACKGYDQALGPVKGIYAFSLNDKKMQPEPVIRIPLAQEQLKANIRKKKDNYSLLQPSSLEFHPKTNELYMLDVVNHKLLTINDQGQIQKLVNLDKNLFKQAEGLSFGPDGEMYIASEGGKKGSGIIVKFAKGI